VLKLIRSELEKMYVVKEGSKKYLVEIRKCPTGKTYVVVHRNMSMTYVKGDDVKEWSHDTSKAEEVDFKSLPTHIRSVISLNLRKL
jgi:23S rRNA C2498 (ribose-2'-O)-methylase RlmM